MQFAFAEWTDDETARLKALWARPDYSARAISRELGKSRNAVLGKAQRLRLPHRDSATTVAGEPRLVPERPRDPRVRLPGLPMPIREEGKTAYDDLTPWSCRFIPGEPNGAETMYCGDPVKDGSSNQFCARHHALCFRPALVSA